MWFNTFARKTSDIIGSSYAFLVACVIVVGWLISGPFFDFNTQWSLFINTITTISTGLIVFVIQHSQNNDTKALHLKMDELIRASDKADNNFTQIENQNEIT